MRTAGDDRGLQPVSFFKCHGHVGQRLVISQLGFLCIGCAGAGVVYQRTL